MKSYFAMFKMKLITGMQYRAAAWAGIATQFFFGFMFIMIYFAFYRSSASPPPMDIDQLAAYMWLQQAFLAIIALWAMDGELLNQIQNGDVAYELCRPYHMFSFWYARLLGQRLSNVLLRCLPILIIAFLLPAPYNMTLPPSIGAGLLFIISLTMALLLATAISMFIYILTLITLSRSGAWLIIPMAEFLMGAVIPIPLMPQVLQDILNWLPFRYISDLPFRVYSGNISGVDALLQIGVQVAWIVLLTWLGNLAFRRVTRKIVIQGG